MIVSPLRAEEFSGGTAAELARATNLLRDPQEDAEIIGRLPKATILNLLGNRSGKWLKIEVELVNGVEQGWVDESALKSTVDEEKTTSDENGDRKSDEKKSKRGKKRAIPEDELAVLKRDSSFVYGVFGGANYGTLDSSYEQVLFQGIGGQGGGLFSFFLNREMTLGVEVGITQLSGAQAPTSTGAVKSGTARLLDIAAVYEYLYRNFRFFGALQYSAGIGIADFPPDQPPSASDFSGLWLKGGVGYSFEISTVLNLVLKGFYGYSFNRVYIGFQNFGVSAYLEFRG